MKLTIAEGLREAAKFLNENNVSNSRREANRLLCFELGCNLTFLIAHDDEIVSDEQQQRFFDLIRRRAAGEPLQYILGKQEFYNLEFEVNKDVLIPRPETEILVETALEILEKSENRAFCDVGTGSGCISIAILKNLPRATGFALDISTQALNVARRNAEKHNVSDRIEFYQSDAFAVFQSPKSKVPNPKFVLIISNPPYIPDGDLTGLQREVREFEPHKALFSGADGLELIRRLLAEAPNFLENNGWLIFEIGFGQSEKIKTLVDENVWIFVEIRLDLQSIPRLVVLQKKC